jgi:hypothetical protein
MMTHGKAPLGTIRLRFTPPKNEKGGLLAEIVDVYFGVERVGQVLV